MEKNEYQSKILDYLCFLKEEERSYNTRVKYERDIRNFILFLGGEKLSKIKVLEYKEKLQLEYVPRSVNSMLSAVNGFLEWLGVGNCKVKPLRIQQEIFCCTEKELTTEEYKRLIQTAKKRNKGKLGLLIQTICATGIRVSELQYITVQSVHTGREIVSCKGKKRSIFLPKDLRILLKNFCKKEKIKEGIIFRTKSGKPIDRSNIWKMMKGLCKAANVEQGKVFPHNLRHLFARTYYKIEKDISRLADILGHSNINTTRIYTKESGAVHAKQINEMKLLFIN